MKDVAIAQLKMACVHAEAAAEIRTAAVRLCRDLGCSWADIGAACGMSRQAAHKRFGHLIGEPDHSTRRRARRIEAVANGDVALGLPDDPAGPVDA